MVNHRKITLELLQSYELEERYVNLLLSSPKLKALSWEERSLVTSLLYTVVENKLKYDYFISSFAKKPVSEIDLYVRNILRLGMCQIVDIDSVPDFAAVNESVKLARHEGERRFINAILRRCVREKQALPYPSREKNYSRYLSVLCSVPYETVKLFVSIYGESETEKIFKAFSSLPELSVTVNENKTSQKELLRKLEGYGAKPSLYSDNGIVFDKSYPPKSLPGFSEGEFFVQDEAARISVEALGVKPSDTVIDVCAAPGGKTLAAALKVGDDGKVYSFDIHQSKLSLISDNLMRLGISNVTVGQHDATEALPQLYSSADAVICDVPCSGLGVFAKKPDLRYKDVSSVKELPELQYTILSESAKYVKAGGVLLYSTCTLNPMENGEITDRFLSEHTEFKYESFSVGELSAEGGNITLLPHIHRTDGFYIAKLRKSE